VLLSKQLNSDDGTTETEKYKKTETVTEKFATTEIKLKLKNCMQNFN